MMRQEDPIYAQEFGEHGSGVNPSITTFAIRSKAPSTYNHVVLKGMEHKIGEAIVRTLSDTFASEAATISMHATHFSKLVVEEQEKQHELKALHVALIVDHKRIFIENAKLKNDLAMQDSTSAAGPRLEELDIRKSTILQISNKVLGHLDEVHASYSLSSQLCEQVDNILSFFQPIRTTIERNYFSNKK